MIYAEPASAGVRAIRATSVARYHGLRDLNSEYLGLAPQALRLRPLRRLRKRALQAIPLIF